MQKVCLFTSPFPFMQAINHGIAACSKRVGPWRVEMQFFADEATVVEFVKRRKYDGVIVTFRGPLTERVAAAGVPVVNALASGQGVPAVTVDERAVGSMGAGHLMECGYKRFAFFGTREEWALRRLDGFRTALASAGHRAQTNLGADEAGPVTEVSEFLDSLKLPVAVMACNDATARLVVDLAIERGVRVPGDLAVLGVDNDELLCETGACPLSSVDTDLYRVGFEAALLLDRRMRGELSADAHDASPVGPKEVIRRQSTSLFAHDDPDVASALRYIHERACDGISVDDVCRHIVLSRRRFEQRFTKALGRPPGVEIRQVRIDRAKALLTETEMTLAEISVRCGYAYISGFAAAFRAVVGMSPGEYRRSQKQT